MNHNKTIYILGAGLLGVAAIILVIQLTGSSTSDPLHVYAFPSLRASASPPIKPEDITRIEIDRTKDDKREKLVFERVDQGWKLKSPETHVEGIDQIIKQFSTVQKEESADLSRDLKELGLAPTTMTVTLIQGKSGREWRLNVGHQSAGKPENAVVYVSSSEVPEPMAVRRSQIDEIFKSVKDLIPVEVLNASALNTTLARFDAPNKPTLAVERKEFGRWMFVKPEGYGEADAQGEPAPDNAPPNPDRPISGVNDLLEAVGALRRAEFATLDASNDDLARFGLARDGYATLRIQVQRTSDNVIGRNPFKEPVVTALLIGKRVEKEGKPTDQYYVRREDEPVVVQVPGKPIEQILKVLPTPEALRDRDLIHVDRGKVDAIDVKNAEGLAKLRKSGTPEAWRLFSLTTPAEADPRIVRELIDALNKHRQVRDFPPAKPDAEYGLDKPVAVVTLWSDAVVPPDKKDARDAVTEPRLRGEPAVELRFGKTDKDLVYVRRQEGSDTRVLAVPATLLAKVTQGPLAYLSKALPSFTIDQAVKLELDRDGQHIILDGLPLGTLTEWKITAPPELAGKADHRTVNDGILAELSRLHPDQLVAEKPDDKDTFGLKKPAITATVGLRDGSKMAYQFGKETADKKSVYARQGEHDVVFLVSAEILGFLRSDLRDRTVFQFATEQVKELRISGWKSPANRGQVLHLVRGDKGWEVKPPPEQPFPLDTTVVDDLVTRLHDLAAERIVVRKTGPEAKHRLDDAGRQLRIEVTLAGTDKPATLTIGALDAEKMAYYAASNARPGDVFLLPERSYAQLIKDGPAYFKKGAGNR
jgi:hypothetical protein